MEREVRWGVLGCAGIARKAMIPAILNAKGAKLYALASRTREKAEAFARMFPCERCYADYKALLTDPCVDAVYSPLPNVLHAEWVIRALEAGKPVFGICRGVQLLNVALGGTLHQHVEGHSKVDGVDGLHATRAEGFVEKIYGRRFMVNSAHHQALDRLGRCEDLLSDLEREQTELAQKLEELRLQGKNKTVQFKELMARKLVNQQLRLRLEQYRLP